jgi:membrane-associated phospholipid phosphatase
VTTSGEMGMVEAPAPLAPPTAKRVRRRRRPTGAAPPLPKHIGATGKFWLAAMIALLAWALLTQAFEPALRATERIDARLLRQIARARTAWLTDVMTAVDRVWTGWTVTAMALAVIVLQMVFRRWRHLFTFLGSVAVLVFVGGQLYDGYQRPRPYDVEIIGRWAGFSMPSPPVAVLATVLLGIAYTIVVPGRPRDIAKLVIATLLAVFATARLYLGVDHPFDVLVGAALGVAIPLSAFRLFTPNDVFPVNYRRAKTAHLDVGGRRGEAIRRAVRDQLGLTVIEAEPVGLEGSGGSTPLRLRVAGDPDTYLFGKLYAMSHVRADRWYKLGRTLLYGRLEDETPFQSVRRLVEYEDYAFRLLRDGGIPTSAPYGIVEITPDREYLLVTEFLGGAPEIGQVEVDDGIIDEGLLLIRRLWDLGLAHRDIKPANLLVRDGKVLLIDAFFVQVRPSPWRQAVDLANMMLVLAVGTDADRVYRRALNFFTPDEIAEAFAAARGVASPTQLRVAMKRDGRNLLGQFRALAPDRPPISLQRWSLRRVGLAIALVAGSALAVSQTILLLQPAHDIRLSSTPDCGTASVLVLMAQSVPSATSLPCIATLPAGWELGDVHIERDRATFSLDSDRGGERAVRATLMPREDCDLSAATSVPSDEQGMRRYEQPERLPPNLRITRYYVFSGGCVTYEFSFDGDAGPALLFDADNALAFQRRATLVDEVRARTGLRLCGAGADCPG